MQIKYQHNSYLYTYFVHKRKQYIYEHMYIYLIKQRVFTHVHLDVSIDMGQTYDSPYNFPGASEESLKDMGTIVLNQSGRSPKVVALFFCY